MKVFKQIGRRTISGGERAKENNRKAILVIFPPSILNDMPQIICACDERWTYFILTVKYGNTIRPYISICFISNLFTAALSTSA